MNEYQAIKIMAAKNGLKNTELSRSLGKSAMYISNLINAETNISIKLFNEVCKTCGYEIILKSDDSEIRID